MNRDSTFFLPVEDEPAHAGIVRRIRQDSGVSSRLMKVTYKYNR
jgi:hypothetical protein